MLPSYLSISLPNGREVVVVVDADDDLQIFTEDDDDVLVSRQLPNSAHFLAAKNIFELF